MSSPPLHPRTAVFFQDKCLSHKFIRSQEKSSIVERPQRLRAVKIGVATAIARLEQSRQEKAKNSPSNSPADSLSNALEQLNLAGEARSSQHVVQIVMSTASVDILNHPAVKYVHGDIDGDVYLERLVTLIRESEDKVARGESEIPEGLSQGDLYLCGQSLDAIQGAVGTVCEAVDTVCRAASDPSPESEPLSTLNSQDSTSKQPSRAFVAIRPPGHHCGEDTPSGFCFLNNVAIGAAHAHLKHGVNRVVILDIDLHHGNGTQSIVWQINEEAYRQQLESEATNASSLPPLRVYYGSIHDPLSYPCEDGNAALVQAASVSLHGPHGQHIENIHLVPYESEEMFWDSWSHGPYARLLQKAEAFLKDDEGPGSEAIIFISAGFDASEYEYTSMSRHGRKVPTAFFKRFARDVRTLADQYSKGRVVSILEGGYGDRALYSGAMAHVLGLAEEGAEVDESWWSLENLAKIEKSMKKRPGRRVSTIGSATPDKWVESAMSLLSTLDPNPSPPPTPKSIPPSTMTLRDRNKKYSNLTGLPSESGTPPQKSRSAVTTSKSGRGSAAGTPAKEQMVSLVEQENVQPLEAHEEPPIKKLPRVLLRVNPPTAAGQGQGT